MNERIRELMELADKFAKENKTQTITGPGNNYFEIFHEKFAELIVKECGYYADVFESLGCPVDMDPTETKPSDYIKKHFGVKE